MTPTVAEVRAQIEKVPGARVLGLHCAPEWHGPTEIEVGGTRYRVAGARSVLEFRQHVVDCERDGLALVCLTDLDTRELGADLLARLARRRLLSPDPWGAVKTRFRVRRVDPELLRCDRQLAVHLLASEPPGGFPLPAGEELSADFAWSLLWRESLGLRLEGGDTPGWLPDLVALLAWSWSGTPERLQSAPPDLMAAASTWFNRRWGAPAEHLLAGLTSGQGRDLLPLGLVCVALFPVEAPPSAAAVRLERFVGHRPVDVHAGRRWGQLALEALAWLEKTQGPQALAPVVHRADQLFTELFVTELARRCPASSLGFHQLLTEFGQALAAWLAAPGPTDDLESLLGELREHREARLSPARLEPVEMAVRLARFLREPAPGESGSLARQAQDYAEHGSFVDRARYKLMRGTGPAELRSALATLFAQVSARREEDNQRFARELSAWYEANSPAHPELLGVEDVLEKVVAPLAQQQPVFLLVLDGATWAVVHELLEDLERRGWSRRATLPLVLATLPSVTEFSRTSLLTGILSRGDQGTEQSAFARHPALVKACTASAPPSLYHKKTVDEARQKSDTQLLARLEERKHKVVGAVVNAVDDHLARSGQFEVSWNLDSLRALAPLLEAALRARRTVVLASDHGHLLEVETRLVGSEGGGERWQSGARAPQPGELRFAGARLAGLGLEPVLAPWSEALRYAPRKTGYHGGATLQEMLAPLVVLAPAGQPLTGLREVPLAPPPWWTPPRPAAPRAPAPLYVSPSLPEAGQGDLFEEATASPLFTALWEAPGFAARAQQRGLDAAPLRRLLEVLQAAPEGLADQALSLALDLPEQAWRELLPRAAAVLNLDGQALLTRSLDGERVVLHADQLAAAFGLAPAVETLEVVTVQGRRLQLPLQIDLNALERKILQSLARHESLSEKALRTAVKSQRASLAIESLAERLSQAGLGWVEPAGDGPEGRIYRFRGDRV